MNSKRSVSRIAIVALASAAAAASGVADAAGESHPPSTLFLQLDTDHSNGPRMH